MTGPSPDAVAPGTLLILDGWGDGPPTATNALTTAATPTLDRLRTTCPSSLLVASGEAVGLLPGTVGNSEIGHLVIGAGRPVPYDSLLVQRQIDAGRLHTNSALAATCASLAATDRALHLVGLCSDGQIHADVEHLGELLDVAAAHAVPRVWVHAITDGRDVPDGTAASYLRRLEKLAARAGCGRLATVAGRAYAMDKAGNLVLTERAGRAIADGQAPTARAPEHAVESAATGDEWVPPSVLTDPPVAVRDGDALLFANFRSDRIQQLADFLVEHLAATGRRVSVLSLTQYDTRAPIPALVGRADASGGLADCLAAAGLRSVRVAEAEKFEHVTYYLNGRDPAVRPLEEHRCVRGDGDADYRARPQMHLDRVADEVIAAGERPEVALVAANLANIDVVGHTGDFAATVGAAQVTDRQVARIVEAAGRAGRWVLLVGDHGNAEEMARPGPNGGLQPYGGHTTNPVPVVVVPAPSRPVAGGLAAGGGLADVAPTVLALLGLPVGPAMTGRSLL